MGKPRKVGRKGAHEGDAIIAAHDQGNIGEQASRHEITEWLASWTNGDELA